MKSLIIEKDNLRYNIKKIKQLAEKNENGNKSKIIAVVKSNAYGLGLVEYTKFLIENDINFFAVSTIEEALELRNAGIKEDILMLSSISIKSEIEQLIKNNIILTIGSQESARIANEIGQAYNMQIRAHLKIDTGFGRYGFIYTDINKIIKSINNLSNVKIEGTFTHFSVSFYDDAYTKLQFKRFFDVVKQLRDNKIETGMLHVCNSSAFLKFPGMHLDAVRIGSAFLGRLSFKNDLQLKKIGFLESNVSEIKELPKNFNIGYSNTYTTSKLTKIAVIPVGYMDGFNITTDKDMYRIIDKFRYIVNDIKCLFKNQNKYVKINNKKCKILGRVGTYHVVCDITDTNIKLGDTAVFDVNTKYINPKIKREYR